MRKKLLNVIIILGLMLIICLGYSIYLINYCTKIQFSKESGFYDNDFILSMTSGKSYSIHYTIDGSKPTMDTLEYNEPIWIRDASRNENVYSMRIDTSVAFQQEEMSTYDYGNKGYVAPNFLVDKCNIIRVGIFDKKGNCVNEDSKVYYVGYQEKEGYDGLYTVSIVTDPYNLFDYETGIYVTGKKYDEFANKADEDWHKWDANYRQTGKEWEKPAEINIFNDTNQLLLSSKVGMRIKGNWSRAFSQKSFSLYAREEYSGNVLFTYDVFQTGKCLHEIVLSDGGSDDYKTKIRENMVQTIERRANSDFATINMIPCNVFLDGEYWGVYYISEDYSESYINAYYNVEKNNIIAIKNQLLEIGEETDISEYYKMVDFIANTDMTEESNFQIACDMIDIDSFIDYYATQIYIGNADWPNKNFMMWRSKKSSLQSNYADTKWRWMLFDVNSRSVFSQADRDTVSSTIQKDELFASMIKNNDFKQKFRLRMNELMNTVYTIENTDVFIIDWINLMQTPIEKNGERFYREEEKDYYIDEIQTIKDFMKERPDYIVKYLDNIG